MRIKTNEVLTALVISTVIGFAGISVNSIIKLNRMAVSIQGMKKNVASIEEKLDIKDYERDRVRDKADRDREKKIMAMELELKTLQLKNEIKKGKLLEEGEI